MFRYLDKEGGRRLVRWRRGKEYIVQAGEGRRGRCLGCIHGRGALRGIGMVWSWAESHLKAKGLDGLEADVGTRGRGNMAEAEAGVSLGRI